MKDAKEKVYSGITTRRLKSTRLKLFLILDDPSTPADVREAVSTVLRSTGAEIERRMTPQVH